MRRQNKSALTHLSRAPTGMESVLLLFVTHVRDVSSATTITFRGKSNTESAGERTTGPEGGPPSQGETETAKCTNQERQTTEYILGPQPYPKYIAAQRP